MTIFFEVLLLAIPLLWFASIVRGGSSLAPWVPTPRRQIRAALQLANLRPGERFYDLGCGDGRAVFIAAEEHGARATGIELIRFLYGFCWLRKRWSPSPNATFFREDLFQVSFADADVVFVYGMEHSLRDKLLPKLRDELRPGARLIVFRYPVPGLSPQSIVPASPGSHAAYLYKI